MKHRKLGALVAPVKRIAAVRGCTPAQVALAWLLAKGEDIVPIPGTRRRDHLKANAAAIDLALTADEIATLNAACPPGAAKGTRYPESAMERLNR